VFLVFFPKFLKWFLKEYTQCFVKGVRFDPGKKKEAFFFAGDLSQQSIDARILLSYAFDLQQARSEHEQMPRSHAGHDVSGYALCIISLRRLAALSTQSKNSVGSPEKTGSSSHNGCWSSWG
jgi:hypothetical protein